MSVKKRRCRRICWSPASLFCIRLAVDFLSGMPGVWGIERWMQGGDLVNRDRKSGTIIKSDKHYYVNNCDSKDSLFMKQKQTTLAKLRCWIEHRRGCHQRTMIRWERINQCTTPEKSEFRVVRILASLGPGEVRKRVRGIRKVPVHQHRERTLQGQGDTQLAQQLVKGHNNEQIAR